MSVSAAPRIAFFQFSCTGLSAEERAAASEFPVFREGYPEAPFERLVPVEGVSCQLTRDDVYRVSEDYAIKELQRSTSVAGGNGVIDVACESPPSGQGTRRCFRSFVCNGMAVRIENP